MVRVETFLIRSTTLADPIYVQADVEEHQKYVSQLCKKIQIEILDDMVIKLKREDTDLVGIDLDDLDLEDFEREVKEKEQEKHITHLKQTRKKVEWYFEEFPITIDLVQDGKILPQNLEVRDIQFGIRNPLYACIRNAKPKRDQHNQIIIPNFGTQYSYIPCQLGYNELISVDGPNNFPKFDQFTSADVFSQLAHWSEQDIKTIIAGNDILEEIIYHEENDDLKRITQDRSKFLGVFTQEAIDDVMKHLGIGKPFPAEVCYDMDKQEEQAHYFFTEMNKERALYLYQEKKKRHRSHRGQGLPFMEKLLGNKDGDGGEEGEGGDFGGFGGLGFGSFGFDGFGFDIDEMLKPPEERKKIEFLPMLFNRDPEPIDPDEDNPVDWRRYMNYQRKIKHSAKYLRRQLEQMEELGYADKQESLVGLSRECGSVPKAILYIQTIRMGKIYGGPPSFNRRQKRKRRNAYWLQRKEMGKEVDYQFEKESEDEDEDKDKDKDEEEDKDKDKEQKDKDKDKGSSSEEEEEMVEKV